jgi:deoxyribonuclease-4
MILGAHESTAGTMLRALDGARRDGAGCFQVFCSSSRQWRQRALPPEEARSFRTAVKASRLGPVAAHASYLINLAAPDGPVRERSLRAMASEIERFAALAIPLLVVHPGSHVGQGESRGVRQVSRGLDAALAGAPRGVTVLLENTAGQGDGVGHLFPHLRDMIAGSRHAGRLGICLDTQHAFAAGFDLRSDDGYERTFAELHAACGLDRLRAFHLNDSKRPLGARVDRHENIGLGHMGLAPFRRLVRDARFARIPGYLETPPIRGKESFARNLRLLRRLAAGSAPPR